MRKTGRRLSLKGRINMAEDGEFKYPQYTQIWADERNNIIWKVVSMEFATYAPNEYYRFDGLDVWTIPKDQLIGTDPFALGFDDNRCFGIYQFGARAFPPTGGVVEWSGVEGRAVLDPDNFITRELGIRSEATARFTYLFVLEEYDTTPVEEVLQLLKQVGQKAGVIDDSSGEV